MWLNILTAQGWGTSRLCRTATSLCPPRASSLHVLALHWAWKPWQKLAQQTLPRNITSSTNIYKGFPVFRVLFQAPYVCVHSTNIKHGHPFADKGPSSQNYGFSSSHVWMWELDHKESWAPKNWCVQTVVLEKTLKSPLDSKKIKAINPKGNQPWILTGRTDAKAEAPVLWPPDAKSRLTGKDPDAGQDWGQREGDDRGWDGWTWLSNWTTIRSSIGTGDATVKKANANPCPDGEDGKEKKMNASVKRILWHGYIIIPICRKGNWGKEW